MGCQVASFVSKFTKEKVPTVSAAYAYTQVKTNLYWYPTAEMSVSYANL